MKNILPKDATKFLDGIIEYSAYMYLFCLPFGKSIVEITSVIIITCFFLKRIITRRPNVSLNAVNVTLLLFVASLAVSFINTPVFLHSLRAFFSKYLQFVIVFLAIFEVFSKPVKIRNILVIAVLSVITISIDAFVQYFTGYDFLHNPAYETWAKGRITACFKYPNDFASWIVMFMVPCLSVALFAKQKFLSKAGTYFLFIVLAFFLYLTRTRGAFLGFLVAVVFIFILKRSYKGLAIFAVIAVLGAGTLILKPDLIPADMFSTSGVTDRATNWSRAMTIYKRHPVIGSGLNTFHANYSELNINAPKGKGGGAYAHNCYLQMATEIGAIGLIAFLAFIFAVFRKCAKTVNKSRGSGYLNPLIIGLLGGILAFLVHAFFDTNLYSLNLNALFWFALGIAQAAAKTA